MRHSLQQDEGKGLAKTALSPISPAAAQQEAMTYLARIGAPVGAWQPFKPGRPIRRHGKRRNGQHRGHINSRTGRSGKQGH